MREEEKKGKIEKDAEKTGEVVEKIGKTCWSAIKGFGKGVKDTVTKKENEKKINCPWEYDKPSEWQRIRVPRGLNQN